ncbi:hypothetical protein J2X14_001105 [Pantoea alhagi]|nr:hypothetical protein [Pantoea alhagi]
MGRRARYRTGLARRTKAITFLAIFKAALFIAQINENCHATPRFYRLSQYADRVWQQKSCLKSQP